MPKTDTVQPKADKFDQVLPDEKLREQARELRRYLIDSIPSKLSLVNRKGEFELPRHVVHLLCAVADALARGASVTVLPTESELTTSQGAQLLAVSRQYFVRLLDEGKIPFSRTGVHRRVQLRDVLEFKAQRDGQRRASLDEMVRLAQEMGGYDKPE